MHLSRLSSAKFTYLRRTLRSWESAACPLSGARKRIYTSPRNAEDLRNKRVSPPHKGEERASAQMGEDRSPHGRGAPRFFKPAAEPAET